VDVDLGFGVITFFGTLTVDEVIDSGGTALAIILAVFFDLTAIASIGSAVALVVFTLVTLGHFRIRHETGARAWLLIVANLTTVVVLVAFALTTLVEEPATSLSRDRRSAACTLGHVQPPHRLWPGHNEFGAEEDHRHSDVHDQEEAEHRCERSIDRRHVAVAGKIERVAGAREMKTRGREQGREPDRSQPWSDWWDCAVENNQHPEGQGHRGERLRGRGEGPSLAAGADRAAEIAADLREDLHKQGHPD
jgi:hypothetical protein